MEELYFQTLPIELNKIIFEYLSDEDLIAFKSLEIYDNIFPIWNDYFYWINRAKKYSPLIKNMEYLIGGNIFDNYLRLKKSLISVSKSLVTNNDPYTYFETFTGYLHDIPYRYLDPKLKEEIKDLYIRSLEYGQFEYGYSEMLFTGYVVQIIFGMDKFRISISDSNKIIYKFNLNYEDFFNLIVLLKYKYIGSFGNNI